MQIYLIAPAADNQTDKAAETSMAGIDTPFTLSAAAGIVSVAAWFPDDADIRICDEAVQEVDLDTEADIIGLSINVSQVARGLALARIFRERGKRVVLGGAHVSLAPEIFRGKADCLVIGEFETVAEKFVADLAAGQLAPEYRCGQADMAKVPPPRWDLYPNDRAVSGVVQTSRGCPFDCTFCDVIQYVGRKQRHKPPEMVIDEISRLYALGYRDVTLSDDNFTVYRQRTRTLLEAIIAWNGAEGRAPMRFATQISIDAARDPELLAKCNRAGLRSVFIGVESSDPDSLAEAQKRQNLRIDLVEECSKVVAAGMTIRAGMIVGFDHDGLDCFEKQFRFLQSIPVVGANISALMAPLATPLYAEMKRQGRIVEDPNVVNGVAGGGLTNILPAKMTREELAEGRHWLRASLLDPDNALVRFEHYARTLGAPHDGIRDNTWWAAGVRRHPMHELVPAMMKDKGARRVILAVREMMAERPEIAPDLTSTLTLYLAEYARMARGSVAARPAARMAV